MLAAFEEINMQYNNRQQQLGYCYQNTSWQFREAMIDTPDGTLEELNWSCVCYP